LSNSTVYCIIILARVDRQTDRCVEENTCGEGVLYLQRTSIKIQTEDIFLYTNLVMFYTT
jgi:hypothetical protein